MGLCLYILSTSEYFDRACRHVTDQQYIVIENHCRVFLKIALLYTNLYVVPSS